MSKFFFLQLYANWTKLGFKCPNLVFIILIHFEINIVSLELILSKKQNNINMHSKIREEH